PKSRTVRQPNYPWKRSHENKLELCAIIKLSLSTESGNEEDKRQQHTWWMSRPTGTRTHRLGGEGHWLRQHPTQLKKGLLCFILEDPVSLKCHVQNDLYRSFYGFPAGVEVEQPITKVKSRLDGGSVKWQ
ncbi:hypothetical protein J0S82_009122, partial [Galemys pyrenaicus]